MVVRQRYLHDNPEGIPGDCLRAAVASLLGFDLDEVPHFLRFASPTDDTADPDDLWWYAFHGFAATLVPPHRWVETEVDPRNPEIPERPCILSGKSPRGDFNHAIAYFGDGLWWDPHPSDDCILSVIRVRYLEPVEVAA